MPIYEYRHLDKAPSGCEEEFEAMQGINDKPLESCPICGGKIKRIVSLPMGHIESGKLSDHRIAKSGLSKYVRSGDGKYELAAGPDDAPKTIDKDKLG
ncbi:MAG: zinc ribbon domain-containing protein [Fimbriimonadales bacterium]|nr:zinc ribbon domain-containing protein [Fimbriimonadales bacterium]